MPARFADGGQDRRRRGERKDRMERARCIYEGKYYVHARGAEKGRREDSDAGARAGLITISRLTCFYFSQAGTVCHFKRHARVRLKELHYCSRTFFYRVSSARTLPRPFYLFLSLSFSSLSTST